MKNYTYTECVLSVVNYKSKNKEIKIANM